MTSDNDVAAAIAGDREAFGALWRALNRPVAAYLRARGVVQVDDVTSEVFISALRGLDGFRGDFDAFKTWLFTIAHHRSVDDLRRRVRDITAPLVVSDPDDVHCAAADDEAIANAERAAAFKLLELLTEEQRAVVLLRILADLSVEQTASILHRSPDAVKKLQRRALARLRRELESRQAVPSRGLQAIVSVT